MPSGESVEPLRFADDDDPDDLGGFSRGKRSYDDDEDEDGGWAINEDHSDRLWDSAEDADDDDEVDSDATVVSEGDDADDEEEEEDLFGGGAPRGRRGRPKGSGKRQESTLTGGGSGGAAGGSSGAGGSSPYGERCVEQCLWSGRRSCGGRWPHPVWLRFGGSWSGIQWGNECQSAGRHIAPGFDGFQSRSWKAGKEVLRREKVWSAKGVGRKEGQAAGGR